MAKVEPGQLRRWNRTTDKDFGKLFIPLRLAGAAEWPSGHIWEFIQDGNMRSYTEETILGWSEVVSEG